MVNIIDCIGIFNEYEMLYIRLNYMYEYVDKFIIFEFLNSSNPEFKKNNFMFNKYQTFFEKFMDKIEYYPINCEINITDDMIKSSNINNDDYVMVSHVNQIPHVNLFQQICNIDNGVVISHKHFGEYLNLSANKTLNGTVAFKRKCLEYNSLDKIKKSSHQLKECDGCNGWVFTNIKYSENCGNTDYGNIYDNNKVTLNNNEEFPFDIHEINRIFPHLINHGINISYFCLIYKSVNWLIFVYEQFLKFTELGENEFYFIANDASQDVLDYLKENNIPHYIHNNTPKQKEEWYINNVYRAWNHGCRVANGKYIMLFNSDMAFTPDWDTKLLNTITDDTYVTSRLVERGILRSGKYGIEKNFGNNYNDYREEDFIKYTEEISEDVLKDGGLFMPLLIKKEYMDKVNYYPEGNILISSSIYKPVYAKKGEVGIKSGDMVLVEKLRNLGIHHKTNFNSIVYHFQEGEMRDETPIILLGRKKISPKVTNIIKEKIPRKKKKITFSDITVDNVIIDDVTISSCTNEKLVTEEVIINDILVNKEVTINSIVVDKNTTKIGWLVNDILTGIPNTLTLWNHLLNNIPTLKDKTDGYTPYRKLAGKIEKLAQEEKPKYIIRNGSYFRPLNIDTYTISLIHDDLTKNPRLLNDQIKVIKSSQMVVFNSQYIHDKYINYVVGESQIISFGIDLNLFKPSTIYDSNILDNSILYIGNSNINPQELSMVLRIANRMPKQNFCLIMKNNISLGDIPHAYHNRFKIFNKVSQEKMVQIMNSCVMCISTSVLDKPHLSGLEMLACNKPIVGLDIGFYKIYKESDQWGTLANENTFVEKINYVKENIHLFTPRKFIIQNGFGYDVCMQKWKSLVENIP